MTSMAWYPLPQSGGKLSAGDEFFENQSAGWSLWSFGESDDQNTASQCGTPPSDQQSEGPAPLEQEFAQRTEDIFMSQFSDEEMRRMDAPFEALDMFPDSMHRLLSYENMLSGVLTGSENQDTELDHNGVGTMDTCGFPLFSHDLQSDSTNAEPSSPETVADPPSKEKAAVNMLKRRRSTADAESVPGLEALVLEELEDVVFQLTNKTRICYRDAFYRLAESKKAKSSATNGATEVGCSRQSFQQPEGNASSFRMSTRGSTERGTNAIDRTVAELTLHPTCSAPPQGHGNGCADCSGAAAQSTVSWVANP